MSPRIALLLACLALSGGVLADDAIAFPSVRFGDTVDISQAVEGPVHAAGGTVIVNAPVNGSVHAAGGKVQVGSDGAISGDALFAGGTVIVDGAIKGDLRAAGGEVRVNGAVAGDASVAAGTLELGPHARIDGKLTFRGKELRRDPGAKVTGGVEQRQGRWRSHEHTASWRFTHGWLWSAGLMVLAALIAAATPGVSRRMAQELRERPWVTPLLGFVALTSIPIAAVLLMVTIIGIPLALVAVMAYIALLFIGYVWVAVVVGGMLLDRVKPETATLTAWRVGAAMLAMLVLAILVRVPFLGHLFSLTALIVGVGMIVAVVFRHSRTGEAHPA